MSLLGSKMFICPTYGKVLLRPLRYFGRWSSTHPVQPCPALTLQRVDDNIRSYGHSYRHCEQVCLQLHSKVHTGHCRLHERQFSHSSQLTQASYPLTKRADNSEQERLITQMNIRLVNENSFLSWCRNAYLSTVVGVAMIAEGSTGLSQGAGVGALVVGTMNLFWGTGCHISNLIRLRHASGMSGLTLTLHVLGSSLHCLLWAFVLVCYIGFLDEINALNQLDPKDNTAAAGMDGLDSRFDKYPREV